MKFHVGELALSSCIAVLRYLRVYFFQLTRNHSRVATAQIAPLLGRAEAATSLTVTPEEETVAHAAHAA